MSILMEGKQISCHLTVVPMRVKAFFNANLKFLTKLFSIIFLVVYALTAGSQNIPFPPIKDTIELQQNPFLLPHKNIEISSIQAFIIDDLNIIDTCDVQFNPPDSLLLLSQGIMIDPGTKIVLHYRIPYLNQFNLTGKHNTIIDSTTKIVKTGVGLYGNEASPLMDFRGLNYNGSFGRGISVGNTQDLNLNSDFNLSIAGRIAGDINIRAVLSDANLPIQAEGNAQQLNEFDKVFIELSKGSHKLIAGDFTTYNLKQSHFLKYYKKLKGIQYEYADKSKKGLRMKSNGSIASSKGKFARQTILTQEGNQGPYKMTGSGGISFFIVLSGTEKVFLDGKLLTRGLENDYVIDYNSAEVTFTPANLINSDSRIIIEYEYLEQNYNRSLYALSSELTKGKTTAFINLYSEQDNKNNPAFQDLSSEDKLILQQAGDDPAKAVSSGSVIYDPEIHGELPVYQRIDTLINGIPIMFFRHNNEASGELYHVSFAYTGDNKGSYQRSDPEQNERTYVWVGFDMNGQPLGTYEPVRILVPPQAQTVVSSGIRHQGNKTGNTELQFSLSGFDQNKFSSLDAADNQGLAFLVANSKSWNISKTGTWKIKSQLSYEFKQRNFEQVNPYRKTEFNRDWNVNNINKADEHLGNASFNLSRKKNLEISYGLSFLEMKENGFGLKHIGRLKLKEGKWEAEAQGSLLTSESPSVSGSFFRPDFNISRLIGKKGLVAAAFFKREKNVLNNDIDILNSGSFWFDQYGFSIKTPVDSSWHHNLQLSSRRDYQVYLNQLERAKDAIQVKYTGKFSSNKRNELQWNVNFRSLVADTLISNSVSKNTFLGRLTYNWKHSKKWLTSNTFYEIGTGQEPRLEFSFQKVIEGQGDYIFIDSNEDGIEQKHEFHRSEFDGEGEYIKVAIYNNEFIKTDNAILNQVFRVDLRNIKGEMESKRWLKKLLLTSSFRLANKVQNDEGLHLNPFIDATSIEVTSALAQIRNTFQYDPFSAKFSISLNHLDQTSKSYLSNGFELRGLKEISINARYNPLSELRIENEVARFLNNRQSELSAEQDYSITGYRVAPSISWLSQKKFRLTTSYSFEYKNDRELYFSNSHDLGAEATLRKSKSFSLKGSIDFIQIALEGEPPAGIRYSMLKGLNAGQNYLWELSIERKLYKNLRMNILYTGRKTEQSKGIHRGTMQIRASF